MKKLIISSLIIFIHINFYGQYQLKPGFNADEYRTMLKISEQQLDSSGIEINLPKPAQFNIIYKSPIKGLDNRFEIWVNPKTKLVVISIRGTTLKSISWIENFYSGMIPAQGKIKVDTNGYMDYKVAENADAYVHAGWMIGMMSLAPDMISQMRKQYDAGYRNFIIFGHSQGGAIAFLFRSYLQYMSNALPGDMIIKTMGSAVPKPGNLHYAYDFEYINQGGWGLRIVNALDWVPEVPFGTQTMEDINALNPFIKADEGFKKLSFFKRIYLKRIYKKLDIITKKTRKRYTKYLGYKIFELVKDHLPEADVPKYSNSYYYTTAGTPVILKPGEAYMNNYLPIAKFDVFNHHMMYPYYLASLETFPERD